VDLGADGSHSCKFYYTGGIVYVLFPWCKIFGTLFNL